ncbi:uncharacterized protein [Drosophila bipectinata]|uniref:uncharacterized protein isoform X1 n=1 Tax=Drosophila bipectinata TaxID=42026 RepID=UPI001C896549|nr:uncharacterized protein LOC108133653 isoform X1 [Drosophila bipectinata]XP_017109149.2 uncharacterized protein LOC108133653 isoform X2 [Drosophila bipectinata]
MFKRCRNQIKAIKSAAQVIASRGEVKYTNPRLPMSWKVQGVTTPAPPSDPRMPMSLKVQGVTTPAPPSNWKTEEFILVARPRRQDQNRLWLRAREPWTSVSEHYKRHIAARVMREMEIERELEEELAEFFPGIFTGGSACGGGSGNGGGNRGGNGGNGGDGGFPPFISPMELQREQKQRKKEKLLEMLRQKFEQQQTLGLLAFGTPTGGKIRLRKKSEQQQTVGRLAFGCPMGANIRLRIPLPLPSPVKLSSSLRASVIVSELKKVIKYRGIPHKPLGVEHMERVKEAAKKAQQPEHSLQKHEPQEKDLAGQKIKRIAGTLHALARFYKF